MNELSLLTSADTKAGKIYSNDVFSAFTYPDNGSTQTIINGIDLAGKGGMVWTKERSTGALEHIICTTALGTQSHMRANRGDLGKLTSSMVSSFNSDGYTLSNLSDVFAPTLKYVSWSFLNARNFYHHTVVTKTSGSNATFTFSTIATLGMVRVKRTDAAGSWYIWHRSLSAGQLLIGETTAAAATLGHITVSGNTVTLVNGIIADGTYLVEAFAHDTGVDGIIQCGITNGSQVITLGWEPQYILHKSTNFIENWSIYDTARGMDATNDAKAIYPNTNGAEQDSITSYRCIPNATGFDLQGISGSHIYLAIRRQNKPPTIGTQVYNAIARTGTGAAATVTGVGFAPDLTIIQQRGGTPAYANIFDRLRGKLQWLYAAAPSAESVLTNGGPMSFDVDGLTLGSDTDNVHVNRSAETYINHFFKRAPGVFDIVCYTETGLTSPTVVTSSHSLGVVPEMIIEKSRSVVNDWSVYHKDINRLNTNPWLRLNGNESAWFQDARFPNTMTSTSFQVDHQRVNTYTHVAYLFATKTGISKVGSYTGNGTSQTIDCGFTTGARFVMIKAISTTGDWLVGDSIRGLISGNDPRISLNSTAAEVTTEDWLDPATSGFIVNEVTGSNANTLGVSYLVLALS